MTDKTPFDILEEKIMKLAEKVVELKKEKAAFESENEKLSEKMDLMEKRFKDLHQGRLGKRDSELLNKAEDIISASLDDISEAEEDK